MEVRSAAKLQCQRIGCNAMFTEDDNPDGSCQFHASVRHSLTDLMILVANLTLIMVLALTR